MFKFSTLLAIFAILAATLLATTSAVFAEDNITTTAEVHTETTSTAVEVTTTAAPTTTTLPPKQNVTFDAVREKGAGFDKLSFVSTFATYVNVDSSSVDAWLNPKNASIIIVVVMNVEPAKAEEIKTTVSKFTSGDLAALGISSITAAPDNNGDKPEDKKKPVVAIAVGVVVGVLVLVVILYIIKKKSSGGSGQAADGVNTHRAFERNELQTGYKTTEKYQTV